MGANILSFDDVDYSEYLYVSQFDEFDFTTGDVKSVDGGLTLLSGRNTVARQFNASGGIETVNPGVVRFKRDPLTGKILGLLAEPAATNVLSYNGQLLNSYWTPHNSTITASLVAGLDGVTMFKMTEDAVNTYHGIPSPLSAAPSSSWVSGRIYAKAAENNFIFVELGLPVPAAVFNATVNLSNGTFTTGGSATGVAKVTACKDGIYLIELSVRTGSAASQTVRMSFLNHNGTTQVYSGTPGNGVYVQYPQLELSPRSTSTIITENGVRSRDADNYYFAMPDGFDSTDMSVCVEAVPTSVPLAPYATGDSTSGVLALRDSLATGSASVKAVIGRQIATLLPQAFARSSTGTITILGTKAWQQTPMLIAYSTAGILSYDGSTFPAAAGFVQAASNRIQVGSSRPDAEYFEGVVTGLLLYKGALSADDLTRITQQ